MASFLFGKPSGKYFALLTSFVAFTISIFFSDLFLPLNENTALVFLLSKMYSNRQ